MKVCSKCNHPRDDESFSKDGHGGRKAQCRVCDRQYRLDHKAEQQAYDKQYYQDKKKPIYEANKATFKEKNSQYYQKNKEEIKGRACEYAAENLEKIKESKKQYYEENKEIILEKCKEYYYDNLDLAKLTRQKYRITHKVERNQNQKKRYETDPVFKLRINLSTSILGSLKKNGSSKNGSSIMNFLPYTIEELKVHLEKQFEPWMNWENRGQYNITTWNDNDSTTWVWQIDHIIPHSKLPYTSMEDENFKKCWSLENLRPLSAKQNNIDGNRR